MKLNLLFPTQKSEKTMQAGGYDSLFSFMLEMI